MFICSFRGLVFALALLPVFLLPGGSAAAQDEQPKAKPLPQVSPEARYDYQGEATFILQNLFTFDSPYEGPNSLRSRNETELSDTYTLFLGARLMRELEVYVNPELAWGNGIGHGMGLAAYTNGDLIGQPSLRPEPYIARYFVRWRVPLGGHRIKETQVGRAPNLIEGTIPEQRLVFTLGKFSVNDIFDVNFYANNPRQQFMNDAFDNNLAYDFAQDPRGYTLGLAVSWVNPHFALRAGTFALPTTAGGPDLAFDLNRVHSDQIEADLYPHLLRGKRPSAIVHLLAYRNVADMGRYRDALAEAALTGMTPDITMVRKRGAVKYGFGLNFEQNLGGDDSATGVFARLGWNNGATESYAFAEADRFLSFGGQMSGKRWGRKDDHVALAFAQSDLSAAHKDYLASGGQGLNLGDGKLRYGSERLLEAYYSYQFSKPLALTLDYQYILNPGYNRDRGPVNVLSLRLHYAF